MNEIIQALHDRKSVRAFLDRPISAENKQLILEAACQASSAGNQQLYTILDITDQAMKDRLAVTCDNQPFIAQAPMVLVFCADCQKWYDAYLEAGLSPRDPGVGDLLLAVTDTAIAAQNAVVAAESLGIGSCYIGDILEQREAHQELLRLPRYVVPCVMLVLGYPTAQQRTRQKPERADLRHIVHENTYRHMDGPELRDLFAKRSAANGYDAYMAAFCKRKYDSDFSREMTRSVAAYLDQFERP
jgi:nitroreductase/FMN reductase (NADPH)/FMN reductase [NAD(P)H]